MSTLRFTASSTDTVTFTPISSTLNNLPNGAGSIAALVRVNGSKSQDFCGFVDSAHANWYHSLGAQSPSNLPYDDDGRTNVLASAGTVPIGSTANDFFICVVTWPSSAGLATERFHVSPTTGGSGSWAHNDSSNQTLGNRAGPGTTGQWHIGYNYDGTFVGDVALIGAWVGIQLSDSDCVALFASKKTSDWWNCPAGSPTLLVECNTSTPADVGASPSTFSSINTTTLTGLDPTSWVFDGRGGQRLIPDATLAAGSWTRSPTGDGFLYSALKDSDDTSYIFETPV